jgi:ABC-2 type transport system ATP-binding protein
MASLAGSRRVGAESHESLGQILAGAPTIQASRLVKRYANGVTAIDGVSLRAGAGEVVGIVGPNGAGKSTTLNVLATLIPPTDGDALVCGIPVGDHKAVRPLLGVALQEAGLDPLMTARDHFAVQGALYGLPRRETDRRRKELLDEFALGAVDDRPVGRFSGGMQRRLALALALLNDPSVVIFDEPTAGLDPGSKRAVWSCIERLRAATKTVIFSTHYLEEAQQLCDRVYLIFSGAVVIEGTPAEIRERGGRPRLAVVADGPREHADRFVAQLDHPSVAVARVDGDAPVKMEIELATTSGRTTEELLTRMREAGLAVREIHLTEPSLEDIFLRLAGESVATEALTGAPIESAARRIRGGRHWR